MKGKRNKKALLELVKRKLQKKQEKPAQKAQPSTPQISEREFKHLALQSLLNFRRILKIWSLVFLSLPVDILLVYLLHHIRVPESTQMFLQSSFYLLLTLSLGVLFRDSIIAWLSGIQGFKESFQKKSSGYFPYFALLIPALVFVDILLKIQHLGIIPILAITAFFLSKVPGLMKKFQSLRPIARTVAEEKYYRALALTEQLQAVFILQIALIRGMTLLGAVLLAARTDITAPITHLFVVLLTGAVLMLIAKPELTDFITNCKRCAARTSRVFRNTYYCPECLTKNYKGTIREAG